MSGNLKLSTILEKRKRIKMKVGDHIIEAAKKQAEGEIAAHIAIIKVYQTMPAGIGEHSDITESSYCRIR